MRHASPLKVLLLTLVRKKLIALLILSVLPPILISLVVTTSLSLVNTQSEAILSRVRGSSVILSREPVGECVGIEYGLARVVHGNVSEEMPYVRVRDLKKLKEVLGLELVVLNYSCNLNSVSLCESARRGLNVVSGDNLTVCVGSECFNACLKYSHNRILEEALIIEGGPNEQNTSFLCVVNSSSVSRSLINHALSELARLASFHTFLAVIAYAPVLYLTNLNILKEVAQELRVLKSLGLSKRSLELTFVTASSTIITLASLYCVALSYLVIYAGDSILTLVSGVVVPKPQPGIQDLTSASIIALVGVLTSYAAFMSGGRGVAS